MAYRDTVGDNARLLTRTIRGVTDFSGRSRRTEVIYYWIACALVGAVINFAVITVVSFETTVLLGNALQLLFLIPSFALVVRRVHDQDRSGWWGVLLPLSVLLSIPLMLTELRGDVHAIIAQKTTQVGVVSAVLGLAVLVLCLLPGTDGPNRYGPDPRLEEV